MYLKNVYLYHYYYSDRETQMIVIDEVSMLTAMMLDKINAVLQAVRVSCFSLNTF